MKGTKPIFEYNKDKDSSVVINKHEMTPFDAELYENATRELQLISQQIEKMMRVDASPQSAREEIEVNSASASLNFQSR